MKIVKDEEKLMPCPEETRDGEQQDAADSEPDTEQKTPEMKQKFSGTIREFFRGKSLILVLLSAALLIASVVLSVLFVMQKKNNDAARAEADARIADLGEGLSSAQTQLESLLEERTQLLAQVEELGASADERLLALQSEIDAKNGEIASLTEAIERYRGIYSVDIREQVDLVNELTDLIENGAPLHNLRDGVDPEVTHIGDIDENGNEITAKDIYIYPNISVYYEDIATGFKYTYHADEVVFSASVIKAMYIVSLLEDTSAAYTAALDSRLNPEDPLSFSDPKFDIEHNKWTLTDDAKREGSGVLSEMEAGTEFTYLELVQYAIEKSDNTAFYVLRQCFGYDSFYALANSLGVTSLSRSFDNLSAQDAGKFLKHIYEFTEKDEHYGGLLRQYLLNTNHNVLIPAAVSPTKAAHKYGWDENAYHDAAIVYSDKPYVLAIMTDMDEGGDEVNAYLRQIIKLIDRLHCNFYG